MASNKNLIQAGVAKNDEFYTELSEIQAEVNFYVDKFKDKVVFCNCDDPFESNFIKFFLMNFNRLGLKELIATGYSTSPIMGTEVKVTEDVYAIRVKSTNKYLLGTQKDLDIKGTKVLLETEKDKIITKLEGNYALDASGNRLQEVVKVDVIDKNGKKKKKSQKQDIYYNAGDFRSDMSISLLKEADIVVTNPPFSLFREYIAQLFQFQKSFLILGNIHAITYKEVFPLFKQNKMWAGCVNGSKTYKVSEAYAKENPSKVFIENEIKYAKFGNTSWYTNLDHSKRHQLIPLNLGFVYKGHEDMYPHYDNYDAIEVTRINQIPCDYQGIMGVPNSFMDKYCPEQFEIVGIPMAGSNEESLNLKVDYSEYIGYSQKGEKTGRKGSTFGACPVFERNDYKNIYYTNGERTVQAGSCERIFIRFSEQYIKSNPNQFKIGD